MVGGRLLSPADVGDLAKRHRITPSKALGQHFVVDQNTIRRIVRLAEVVEGDRILEVGAGIGTLTLALADSAAHVKAIEIDKKLIPALVEALQGRPNVDVVVGDALRLDYPKLTAGLPHRLVSNLPYNIATPLVATILQHSPDIYDLVVMVQREVGERLVAGPGSRAYGSFSVLIAYHCHARLLGKVPPNVFWPVPKVESLLVRLTRRTAPVEVDADRLMIVVRAAFGQRRKVIRNSLASGLGRPATEVEAALAAAGLSAGARAESLGLQDFARLVRVLW